MEESQELLNDVVKYYKFTLNKLLMQNQSWEMSVSVLQPIPKVWKAYELHFTVDLSTFEKRLELNARSRTEASTDLTLFPQDQENALKRLDQAQADIFNEQAQMEKNCPDIVFTAFVTKVEYKPEKTVIAFNIGKENVQELNDRLFFMLNYKLSMTHL
jgi:hypothetical protein